MIHAFKDEYGFLCEWPTDWAMGAVEIAWCLQRAPNVGIGGKHYCEAHDAQERGFFVKINARRAQQS
jgi:hypothetical protein